MNAVAWLRLAVLVWTAVQARELLVAWSTSPYDRFGWAALALWAAGGVVAAARSAPAQRATMASFAAVAATFVGTAGQLNAACYAGLALAIAGFAAPGWAWAWWLACAAAWWPALGWTLKNALGADAVPWLRLAIAAAGAVPLALVALRRRGRIAAQEVPA